MPPEHPLKRAVVSVDRQNLFDAAREAFGHSDLHDDVLFCVGTSPSRWQNHRTLRRLLRRISRLFEPKRRVPARPASLALETPYRDWLGAWASLWSVPDLPAKALIVFSRRLTSALGRCTPPSGSIRLRPGLLDAPPETLREVVCHEAAHVAAWLLHGRRARPHGREWKQLMRLAGYEPHVRWAEGSVPLGVRRRRAAARENVR